MQLRFQVLAITPRELRTYQGRSYFQRTFNCFGEGSVFTHSVSAPAGDSEESVQAQKQLDAYQPGFYDAELTVAPGDRGRATFSIRNLKIAKSGQVG